MGPDPTEPADPRPLTRADGGVGSSAVAGEVHGDGLLLRPWRPDDAEALVGVYDDPEAARWTPVPSPFDLGEARAYLRRAEERQADGFPQLAVVHWGEVVGEVRLMPTGEPGTCELGYAVAAAHRGRGLATQSLALLLSVAAGGGYDRARLRIVVGNRASEAVARRLAFLLDLVEPVEETRKGTTVRIGQWSRELTTVQGSDDARVPREAAHRP